MTKRNCRNPHRTDGLTGEQVIALAMKKFGWSRAKCLSWYEKENASLKHARPRELVERGQTEQIEELLDKREFDRKKEDQKREEARLAAEELAKEQEDDAAKKASKKTKKSKQR